MQSPRFRTSQCVGLDVVMLLLLLRGLNMLCWSSLLPCCLLQIQTTTFRLATRCVALMFAWLVSNCRLILIRAL